MCFLPTEEEIMVIDLTTPDTNEATHEYFRRWVANGCFSGSSDVRDNNNIAAMDSDYDEFREILTELQVRNAAFNIPSLSQEESGSKQKIEENLQEKQGVEKRTGSSSDANARGENGSFFSEIYLSTFSLFFISYFFLKKNVFSTYRRRSQCN